MVKTYYCIGRCSYCNMVNCTTLFWLYGSHLASEWTKEDERREAVALKDITKADSIARELFKESAEDVHLYNQLCWKNVVLITLKGVSQYYEMLRKR